MIPPEISIRRLSQYRRILENLIKKRPESFISSEELAKELDINPPQVRKDLSYFGQFGRRGKGYFIKDLLSQINNILGLNRSWNICLCGLGNLGSALIAYKGFKEQGLIFKAIFDNDPQKIGKIKEGINIFNISDAWRIIKEKNIEIAIITVPQAVAQEVADRLIEAGIRAILNFAPTKIIVPAGVKVRNVDLSTELINLTYFLSQR